MTILASDSFTGTGDSALSANWTTITSLQGPVLSSNEARNISGSNAAGARFSGALVGGGAWPDAQYSEVIIGGVVSTTSDEGVGPACRIATAAQTFYLGQGNTTQSRLYKDVATTFTQLGSDGASVASTNPLRMICNGTSISLTKSGSTIVGPVTDSSIASGQAGFWCTQPGGPGTAARRRPGVWHNPRHAFRNARHRI
jgi:hypothetical protein